MGAPQNMDGSERTIPLKTYYFGVITIIQGNPQIFSVETPIGVGWCPSFWDEFEAKKPNSRSFSVRKKKSFECLTEGIPKKEFRIIAGSYRSKYAYIYIYIM